MNITKLNTEFIDQVVSLTPLHWIVGVIGGVIICLFLSFLFKNIRQKECKKNKHNFKMLPVPIVLGNKYPRTVWVCDYCNVAVHKPVYSEKRLQEIKEGRVN